MDEPQTEELTITSRHVPVSVAINDNLTNEPVFIVDQDPGNLINSFMEDLQERQIKIAQVVESLYPQPESDEDEKEDGGKNRKVLFGGIGLIKFLFLVLIRAGMTLT